MSDLLQALYRGEQRTGREALAAGSELDVFEAGRLPAGRTDCASCWTRIPRARIEFADDGFHPLRLACFFGHLDAARLLLDRGADVNALSTNEHVQTAALFTRPLRPAGDERDALRARASWRSSTERTPTCARAAASRAIDAARARTVTRASRSCCSSTAQTVSGPSSHASSSDST